MTGGPDGSLVMVKLGGSLITDKAGDAEARDDLIARLAGELSEGRGEMEERLLIGHGSGSFGHPPAAEHGLRQGADGREGRLGLGRTQRRASDLHRKVVGALLRAGVPAFSVVPSSAAVADDASVADFAAEPLLRALRGGYVPVTYGDVMMDRARGSTIASTEAVFLRLVRLLGEHGWRVRRVLWLGTTDGVLDRDGRPIRSLEADGDGAVPRGVGGAEATDVTGGMRHRVEAALELGSLGVASWIGDGRRPGVLRRALAGDMEGGTRVSPAG